MVHVPLIIRLLCLVFAFFASSAWAQAENEYKDPGSPLWRSSVYDACNDYRGRNAVLTPSRVWVVSSVGTPEHNRCDLTWTSASTGQSGYASALMQFRARTCPVGETLVDGVCAPRQCPAGLTLVGDVCQCPEGEVLLNGVCTPTGCPVAGTGAGGYSTDSDSIAFTCETFNGRACTIKIVPTVCVRYEQDGRTYSSCHGEGKFTGTSCWGGSGNGDGSGPGSDPGDPGPGPDPTPNPGGPGAPDQGDDTPIPTPSPPMPPPQPQPREPDDSCPEGTTEINGSCIKDPEEPQPDGSCPSGAVRVGDQCVYSSPPGNGGSGSGGTPGEGEEGGDCEPGSMLLKCSSMGGLPGGDGISRSTRNMTFAPDDAMATSGSCPSSVTIPLLGTTLTVVDMAEACDLITTYVRPIAILLSAFMALGIAAGVLKTDT